MIDQADKNQVVQLVLEMGSKNNNVALRAVNSLRELGHLSDGTLEMAKLRGANLEDAKLSYANLRGAFLGWANLKGAFLVGADLQKVILWSANLQGANLEKANIEGAVLENAFFDETTILPDGLYWSPDANLARFTHPHHPGTWYPVRFAEKLEGAIQDLTPPDLFDFSVGKPVGDPYQLFKMSWRLTKGKSRRQINRLIAYLYRLSEEARKRASKADNREMVAYWLGVSSGLRRAVLELRLDKRDPVTGRPVVEE